MPRAILVAVLALSSCARPPPLTIAEPAAAPSPRARAAPRRNLPISGGTLLVSRDGRLAAVSDPEGDRVWLVDLAPLRVRAEVALAPGDEPGRIVEDYGLRFHVALRRGGALATLDERGELMLRRAVCPSPRGVDLDPSGDTLHVACAGGELVTLGVLDPSPRRTLHLEPDLRDVVAAHDRLHVTRFRSAEVLSVDGGGAVAEVRRPDPWDLDALLRVEVADRPRRTYEPSVAWRLVKDPRTARIWMIHQRAARFPVDMRVRDEPPPSVGYGGFRGSRFSMRCEPGISHAAITPLDAMTISGGDPSVESALSVLGRFALSGTREATSPILEGAVLPVDVAFAPDGAHVAMAFPGNVTGQLAIARTGELSGSCAATMWEPGVSVPHAFEQPVAVAWIDDEHVAVQYRRPHALVIYPVIGREDGRWIELGERAPRDRGDGVFHEGTRSSLACASCHPEGGDDGLVWDLGGFGGRRRTQTLFGGVMESAPFHWAGDLASLDALVDEVFVTRMGGRPLSSTEIGELGGFLASLPEAPRASVRDPDAVRRGRALFARTGCLRCHSGPRWSDDETHDVGTGEALQTPTLVGLAARPPYLHDGRAATLRDRFTRGHTPGHGDLSRLSEEDVDDLTAYLASL